jgi:CheY-like chemotaxis protein
MMGGSIDVASEPGKGTTFTLRLPADVVDETKPDTSTAETAEIDALPEGSCVLVIDDEQTSRDLIRRALEREGHAVAVAASGDEGIEQARELEPQLITLDVLMPGKDGWAVLRELKADPQLRDIPVVMISMLDGSEMGFALGATDYLSKPIDRDHLRAVLLRHGVAPASGRVLVVDDDAKMREIVRAILEKEDCKVVEASDGKEALDRLHEDLPDLIILDLMMPVMDGFEFIHELRQIEAWRGIPVVVATAKDLSAKEREALSGSVEAVIQKNACGLDNLMVQARNALAAHATAVS